MEKFSVGEIAIGRNFVRDLHCNGADILIVDGPFDKAIPSPDGSLYEGVWFAVLIHGETLVEALPIYHLRKKRPPESDESTARQAMLDCIERAKMPAEVSA